MRPAAPPTASHALPTLPSVLMMVAALWATAISAPPPGLAAVPPTAGTRATPPDLESRLRARIAEAPGEVGLALVDLETGLRIGIGDTVRMHAASTMKVPVMLELYRQAAAGEFSIDGTMVVRNAFRSIRGPE